MSLKKNVLLRESIASERRRRSSTSKELEKGDFSYLANRDNALVDGGDFVSADRWSPKATGTRIRSAVSLDDSGSEFPIFVDSGNNNDDAVFLPTTSEEGAKVSKKRRGLRALLNSRILDDETGVIYGESDDGGGGGGGGGIDTDVGDEKSTPRSQLHSRVKRPRPNCDRTSSPSRARSRSNSSKIANGSFSKVRPVRRWTKVNGEWVPSGGVRKRVPGGLKDRLLKRQERLAAKKALAETDFDKDHGMKTPYNSPGKNKKSVNSTSQDNLMNGKVDLVDLVVNAEEAKVTEILKANDNISIVEAPWSV